MKHKQSNVKFNKERQAWEVLEPNSTLHFLGIERCD